MALHVIEILDVFCASTTGCCSNNVVSSLGKGAKKPAQIVYDGNRYYYECYHTIDSE